MKKIMIVFAAIALAFASEAASFKWSSNSMQYVYKAGGAAKMTSGTVYLFDAGTLSQAALLSALQGGGSLASQSFLSSTSLTTSGTFTKTENFSGVGADQVLNAYFAIQDGDNVFISDTKTGTGQASATTPLGFATTSATKGALSTASSFSAGGWYAASSTPTDPTPEPTSGLLLLVGGAMLALRRKQK